MQQQEGDHLRGTPDLYEPILHKQPKTVGQMFLLRGEDFSEGAVSDVLRQPILLTSA